MLDAFRPLVCDQKRLSWFALASVNLWLSVFPGLENLKVSVVIVPAILKAPPGD